MATTSSGLTPLLGSRPPVISEGPPAFEATTGTPAAMPSMTTCPKGSGITEACTSTSISASSAGTSAWNPRRSTRPARPSSWTSAATDAAKASSPNIAAPTTRARSGPAGKAWAKARRNTSWPFHGDSRPTMPTVKGRLLSRLCFTPRFAAS